MREDQFNKLVSEALDALPQEFVDKLDNVDVVVEVWPTVVQLHSVNARSPYQLLGLYQGVPQTKRRNSFQLPDKISIFAGPILNQANTNEAVKQLVERVVKHEIAHHFGMDDHAIRKRGY